MLSIVRGFSKLAAKPNISPKVYRTADGSIRDPLTVQDVGIILNPSEELIDEFMKGYGKQRLNFKKEDLFSWKRCFQDDYSLVFVCLKGTNTITHTVHFTNYYPISTHSDLPHQYGGFFWINPDYRGSDSMKLTEHVVEEINDRSKIANTLSHCFPTSMNFFKRFYGHNNYGHIQSVSYYKMDEMRVPENLNFDGIHIKVATEVPDEDVVKYDQEVFPYERSKYVLSLLRDQSGYGKVAYDSNEEVIGFGTVIIYPSGECVLSPLYADDTRVAQAIFKSILEQIPLDDKKLLRFHVRTVDKCPGGFEWIQPFVKCPIRKELGAYLCYVTHLPKINYDKVFVNFPYTNCAI